MNDISGVNHTGLQVPDIHATFDRLTAAGVTFKSEAPVAITHGVNQGGYAVYFTDPDGIALELLQLRQL